MGKKPTWNCMAGASIFRNFASKEGKRWGDSTRDILEQQRSNVNGFLYWSSKVIAIFTCSILNGFLDFFTERWNVSKELSLFTSALFKEGFNMGLEALKGLIRGGADCFGGRDSAWYGKLPFPKIPICKDSDHERVLWIWLQYFYGVEHSLFAHIEYPQICQWFGSFMTYYGSGGIWCIQIFLLRKNSFGGFWKKFIQNTPSKYILNKAHSKDINSLLIQKLKDFRIFGLGIFCCHVQHDAET